MNIEQQLKDLQKIAQTASERAHGRERLHTFMRATPLTTPVVLPQKSVMSFSYSARLVPLFVAILLIAGGGASAAVAAGGALPGDILYPVKVNVNEKVAAAFAVTGTARASLDADLAAERVDEAAKLSAKGKLTEKAAATLKTRLTTHLKDASREAAALSAKGDARALAGVRANVKAALSTHPTVLADLGVSVTSGVPARAAKSAVMLMMSAEQPIDAAAEGGEEVEVVIAEESAVPSSFSATAADAGTSTTNERGDTKMERRETPKELRIGF